jgi:hypothetical protein
LPSRDPALTVSLDLKQFQLQLTLTAPATPVADSTTSNKGTLARDLRLLVFSHETAIYGSLDHALNYFRIWFQFFLRYATLKVVLQSLIPQEKK